MLCTHVERHNIEIHYHLQTNEFKGMGEVETSHMTPEWVSLPTYWSLMHGRHNYFTEGNPWVLLMITVSLSYYALQLYHCPWQTVTVLSQYGSVFLFLSVVVQMGLFEVVFSIGKWGSGDCRVERILLSWQSLGHDRFPAKEYLAWGQSVAYS